LALQKASLEQAPRLQASEQHSSRVAQLAPVDLQAGAGGEPQWPVPSQKPVQQCCEATQASPAARHWLAGSTHIPFWQALEQQSAAEAQPSPTARQVAGSTHWFPAQAREQQVEGSAQAPVLAVQLAAGWQVLGVPLPQVPEQQSAAAAQPSPFGRQRGGGATHFRAVQNPEQQSAPAAQSAARARQAGGAEAQAPPLQ
jgi:hypothetical protein